MRHILLAAGATLAIASPALARDNSGYVGLEGGLTKAHSSSIGAAVDFTNPLTADILDRNVARQPRKVGYDIDAIAGYDFGMFRLEGELGYKSSKNKHLRVDSDYINAFNAGSGNNFTEADYVLRGRTSVLSAMLNGMVDFGPDDGINGFVGAGIGRARVKAFDDHDSAWAYQLIAGARMPVSENVDLGLKYRYFRTGRLTYNDQFNFGAAGPGGSSGTAYYQSRDHYSSHSLLASVIYNFGAPMAAPEPMAPPPPPPPAPATQTCPDGSVILATDPCPAPPPPPPPPAPVERGERGQ